MRADSQNAVIKNSAVFVYLFLHLPRGYAYRSSKMKRTVKNCWKSPQLLSRRRRMGRPLRSDSLKDIRFDGSPLSLQPRSPFATHGPAVLTWPVADRASPYFLTTFPTTVSPETCGVSLSDPVRAFFFWPPCDPWSSRLLRQRRVSSRRQLSTKSVGLPHEG